MASLSGSARRKDSLAGRRHDLDALRAFAMLLGIALHASLSFFPAAWPVQDSQLHAGFGVFMAAIHGFRMQLFFLLSGFFTMMMYRSRGLKALVTQRTLRILLPCIAGVFTVVPLMGIVSGWAMQPRESGIADIQKRFVGAIRASNISAVQGCIDDGLDLHQADKRFGIRPLHWASLVGSPEVVELMIQKGADVNLANDDGNSPLHAAAFLGHVSVVEILLKHGANVNMLNREGSPPLFSLDAPADVATDIAAYLELPKPDTTALIQKRNKIRELLRPGTAVEFQQKTQAVKSSGPVGRILSGYSAFLASPGWLVQFGDLRYHLIYGRMFDHLWFLWFLSWLMVAFAMIVWLRETFTGLGSLLASRLRRVSLFWLIPITMVPQFFMGIAFPQFGPDTSTGVIPQPHILLYYGLFFAFGIFYFEAKDSDERLGRRWWVLLPLALCVLFPAGLATQGHRTFSIVLQPAYAWMMSIGMIGLFRAVTNRPSNIIRYLSDASYWLYLTHLPLVISLQAVVRDWTVWPLAKFVLINTLSVVVLLVTYHFMVRYTWIGLILNGRRFRQNGVIRKENESLGLEQANVS